MNYIQLDPVDVSHFNLPKYYAVVTTAYTSDTRHWKSEYVNEVSDYLNSIGVTPVFLGKAYTHAYKKTGIFGTFDADYTKGINLIDKTNLFEAHAIMANAKFVMGIDNGLLHLASMSQVPVIWGFTSVLPEHRLPYRNGIKGDNTYLVTPSEEELPCTGCQSKFNFAPSDHSFLNCWYDDLKCLDLMTSDRWIEQIKKILKTELSNTVIKLLKDPNFDNLFTQKAYEVQKSIFELNQKSEELPGWNEEVSDDDFEDTD
jgi:ADP-heptose:LPS heptosyltransferase